jgi:hypothetical protein
VEAPNLTSFKLYREGRIDACLRQCAAAVSIAERILRVRALMRKNDHISALDAIAGIECTAPEDEALLLALKSSCHSYRGELDLARAALATVPPLVCGVHVRFELVYAQSLIAFIESDPDAMHRALQSIDVSAVPEVYGRWLFARSWVASLRGEYREQLDWLEAAATHIDQNP